MDDDDNDAEGPINPVYNWFANQNDAALGSLVVFLDHTMKIVEILGSSPSPIMANIKIETMLANLPEMSMSISNDRLILNTFQLTRFYPNPFNPVLNINFDMSQAGVIQVEILDIGGAHIETLFSGFQQPGSYQLNWNAESMPSGVYLVSLNSDDKTTTEKVVLLK